VQWRWFSSTACWPWAETHLGRSRAPLVLPVFVLHSPTIAVSVITYVGESPLCIKILFADIYISREIHNMFLTWLNALWVCQWLRSFKGWLCAVTLHVMFSGKPACNGFTDSFFINFKNLLTFLEMSTTNKELHNEKNINFGFTPPMKIGFTSLSASCHAFFRCDATLEQHLNTSFNKLRNKP
jgi:hypothetical protein